MKIVKEKLIRVLKRDIQKGIRADPYDCPVARASRRARIRNVSVCLGRLDRSGQWKYPAKVATFIRKFDGYFKVKPFSFIAKKREL